MIHEKIQKLVIEPQARIENLWHPYKINLVLELNKYNPCHKMQFYKGNDIPVKLKSR